MQDAIVRAHRRPSITMSVDSIVYRGQNQIRRNVAKTTSLYIGTACYDRVVDIGCLSSLEFFLAAAPAQDVFDTPLPPVQTNGRSGSNTDVFDAQPNTEWRTKCLHIDVDGPVRVMFDDSWELLISKHLCLDSPIYKVTVFNDTDQPVRMLMTYLV